ncbi:MAG: hypothetical protein ACT4OI_06940, partial [Methanobacteriota archaeon]
MALRDFLDRTIAVRAGGRIFTLRPISVLGFQTAVALLSEIPGGESSEDPLGAVRKAAEGGDVEATERAIAELYLGLLDRMGIARFARLLALI